VPYIYDYVEKDGFEGSLTLDSKDQAETWLEDNEGGTISFNDEKTARYNQQLTKLLTSREQMALFRHG
jgi:hypothetical protein